MADTVIRIEDEAFCECSSLEFVKLSTNLEYIGDAAFCWCSSLTSIFISPSCREIDGWAFAFCKKLIIFVVSGNTQLGRNVFVNTELFRESPFEEVGRFGRYNNHDQVNRWVSNINADEKYALHRACCSFNPPLLDTIYQIAKRNNGLHAFKVPNRIGITPSKYLEANPFGTKDIQKKVNNRYILEMMGEIE